MTSVAPANSSEMSASTFSYAQAAKGQGTVPPSNSSAAAAASQPQESQAPVDADAAATTAAIKTAAPDAEQVKSTEVPEIPNDADAQSVAPEKRDIDSATGFESDARSDSTQDRRPDSRRDDDASRLDRPWRRNDKGTRSSSAKSGEDQDSRKARRSKKGKTSEKPAGDSTPVEKEQEVVPEQPKVELSEAPIPSVNIWQKRQEAHLAKGKPAAPGEQVNGHQEGTKSSTVATQESSAQNEPVTNGVKPRKGTDASRPERNGPRGSRVAEKEIKGVPPPVDDSIAWPTPETAIKEVKEERKKSIAERSDKDSQEDASQGKRQKEKWVAYEYVPTVNFETQLPQMRNTKPRGGRSGARDAGARTTTNGVPEKTPAAPLNKSNDAKPREANGPNGVAPQPQTTKRASVDATNQKKAANADKAKDSAAQSTENVQASRPEGRGERGRGGYRGRGAHLSVNSQSQHQHTNSAGAAGFNGQGPASRAQGPYSPPLRQGAHGQMFVPPAQRGRGGRNGAGNYHRMSLPNGQARIPTVQAQFPPYDYSVPPMAGMTFQPHPYWDNMVIPMLKSQIEYYFSIENLCKDMYLRARMDSQGFVPLHFISAFKRMRELSPDIGLIRAVCEESTDVEYVVGEDDCERLRRREGWEKFVLPMEERDELARNQGPAHLTFKNRSYAFGNHFNGVPPVPYGAFPNDPSFQQYPEGAQPVPGVDSLVNGNATTQLSADVPDFAPSGSLPVITPESKDATAGLTNGHTEAPLTNGVHAEHS